MFLVKAVALSSLVGVTPCPEETKEGAIPSTGHFPGPLCSQRFHSPPPPPTPQVGFYKAKPQNDFPFVKRLLLPRWVLKSLHKAKILGVGGRDSTKK